MEHENQKWEHGTWNQKDGKAQLENMEDKNTDHAKLKMRTWNMKPENMKHENESMEPAKTANVEALQRVLLLHVDDTWKIKTWKNEIDV